MVKQFYLIAIVLASTLSVTMATPLNSGHLLNRQNGASTGIPAGGPRHDPPPPLGTGPRHDPPPPHTGGNGRRTQSHDIINPVDRPQGKAENNPNDPPNMPDNGHGGWHPRDIIIPLNERRGGDGTSPDDTPNSLGDGPPVRPGNELGSTGNGHHMIPPRDIIHNPQIPGRIGVPVRQDETPPLPRSPDTKTTSKTKKPAKTSTEGVVGRGEPTAHPTATLRAGAGPVGGPGPRKWRRGPD